MVGDEKEPLCFVNVCIIFRDGTLRINCCSFGFCPNYLPSPPPIPIRTNTTFFRRRISLPKSLVSIPMVRDHWSSNDQGIGVVRKEEGSMVTAEWQSKSWIAPRLWRQLASGWQMPRHPAPDRAASRSSILSVAFFGTMMHLRGASLTQRRLFWPEEFLFSSEALNFRAPLS